ncbi:MAG TPA: methyltransferase domain-containing protein [Thermoanaerobaculia bacterium]|jgi:phospholipid N-methyltransferase|nr:methyltransferase domain-containing protein [Thermoanaerobaculia bacterium]
MLNTAKTKPQREPLLLFARNFFKHPLMLGSLIPSSRYLIDHLLRHIDWQRARVIVEYGPGVGTITEEVLQRMPAGGTLVAIERNEEFVEFLRESLPDPRLRVAQGSAEDVGKILESLGCGPADYIISGIPFSTMPEELRDRILRTTRAVLRPDGAFLVYQFSSKVWPDLQRVFHQVERAFEPRNVLPAWVFKALPGH